MLRSTLSDSGQTTIPAPIRKALNLKPRQKLVYEIRNDGFFIKPENETLMDLYGSFISYFPTINRWSTIEHP